MEENPYKAPVEHGAEGPPQARQLLILALGVILLIPACWALGRAMIPPDDIALRFSVIIYIPATVLWLAYTRRREMIEPDARKQLIAFTVASFCFVVAIVLRLVAGDWLDPHWICLSVGFVAFMAGATRYRQRQG
ncbi:MAG TPA: hypothetical protein VG125_04775 [Pirellulales bacterium]|nr:hypothetical protein [Pirellulales bacterium]